MAGTGNMDATDGNNYAGTVLVTGGAGYVGIHVAAALMDAGHRILILDNFSNSTPLAVDRLNGLGLGHAKLVEGDVQDETLLDSIFSADRFEGVVHLAGLKAVGESVADPLRYYDTNVGGALALMAAMVRNRIARLIFSSTATVYGDPVALPIREDARLSPENPYGRSKLMIERMLQDIAVAHPWMRIISLRYFNPVGAHPSGRVGEDPKGVPNNLFPYIARTAVGALSELKVFGDDWPTPDGTGVRDYLHVMDIAEGHVAALKYLIGDGGESGRNVAINLGSGRGTSVLDVIRIFSEITGRKIPYRIVERRPGDVAANWADPTYAERLLGWKAKLDMAKICHDHWNWQSTNPNGYGD